MHVLYIHQHFATPAGSTGTRSYEFARRWVRAGHKVTVITGHYDIGGLEAARGLYCTQNIDGINVVIVGTSYSNKQSYLRRIISFVCFILLSTCAALRIKKVNIVYATSTPLTVGIPAMLLKWLKRVPFVFEVRDQWPELPIEMGIIKNRLLIRTLLWLERIIYRHSSGIIALSPGMADGVRSVLKSEKPVVIIPNSSDTGLFRPDIDGSSVRENYGWKDKLVLLHAGAMGRVNNLDFVVDAAERLNGNREILFVLIGEGNQKVLLQQRLQELSLPNVEILPSVPKSLLPKYLAAANVGLVIIGNYPIVQNNSSNKFFDSLSAGKPVLLNYSGWQRKILEDNGAGSGCELCNLDEFIEKVLYLNSHRDRLADMGQNARRLAVEEFSRDKLAMQALEVIISIKSQAFGQHAMV